MKPVVNLKWVMLTLMVMLGISACQKENPEHFTKVGPAVSEKSSVDCFVTTNLIAGQFTDVGEVFVTHDETNIYVSYRVFEAGWCLLETHLHIATSLAGIPMTKSGNPQVGRFEFQGEHNCLMEYTYTIPLAWAPGAELVIAAHAVVSYSNGDNAVKTSASASGTETAWGEGPSFPGNNWAMYFAFTLCDNGGGGLGQESEKAYAYAPDGSGTPSQCFLDLGISDEWGFIVGPFIENFTFELWALPNTCSFTNGFHVGEVSVVVRGANKMDITYTTYPGFSLDEAHIWISSAPWPQGTMVDPEDFPYHAYDLGGSMSYTFRNVTARGPVYLIAYAKVYGVIHIG